VIGDGLALAQHPHSGQVGDDLDPPADDPRMHRVVVAVQADVVITRQPQRRPPSSRRGHRGQREHPLAVGGDPIGRRAPQRAATAGVDQGEPLLQLKVEIVRAGEDAAGQERALQVVVGAFDQALGLRVGRFAHDHLGCEGAAEGLAFGRELHPAAAPAPDRALPVPDQHPRHRVQPADELPPAGEQISRGPGRDQQRRKPPGVTGDHGQHRQLRRVASLTEPDRERDRREPQVTLRDLARRIAGARGRSGGRYTGRSSATRADSTRIEWVQPIRSAITVAGILGYARSNSRTRGSTASTIDPARLR
jgi:hypothetical protein